MYSHFFAAPNGNRQELLDQVPNGGVSRFAHKLSEKQPVKAELIKG
jgi:hypothetical protein